MRINDKKIASTISVSLVLIAVSLMFLIAGCSGAFSKGKTATIKTYDFRKGTDGLVMEFIEGMPPSQLFIGTDFSTGVKMKNNGAYDITDRAALTISVPDESAFEFKEGSGTTFTLNGKSLYIKEGEEDIVMFPMRAMCFPGYEEKIVTNYTRKIKASACYYYETVADADVCIDTQKFKRRTDEKLECKMQDVTLSGGQGGPVGVVSISPNIIPQSETEVTVQLGISINKLKDVDHIIYHPEKGCVIDGQNIVLIEAEMGGQPLQCEPSEIKLTAKTAVGTICRRVMDPSIGAFTTPIVVKMRYYVQQNVLREITVEPPPTKPGELVNCDVIKGTKQT